MFNEKYEEDGLIARWLANPQLKGCRGVNRILGPIQGHTKRYEVILGVFNTKNTQGQFVHNLNTSVLLNLTRRPLLSELGYPDDVSDPNRAYQISIENSAGALTNIDETFVTIDDRVVQVIYGQITLGGPNGKILQKFIEEGMLVEFGYRGAISAIAKADDGSYSLQSVTTFDIIV